MDVLAFRTTDEDGSLGFRPLGFRAASVLVLRVGRGQDDLQVVVWLGLTPVAQKASCSRV